MSVIRILILIHVLPHIKTLTTLYFESLLPYLKTRHDVHVTWVICSPDKLSDTYVCNSDETILDIHNYKNAYDIIKKEKPNLVFASPDWGFIHYAFSLTAHHFNIPVFFIVPHADIDMSTKKYVQNIKSNITRFFESSTPTDTSVCEKKLFKRGRFFIYKYIFLLKTNLKLKKSIFLTLFSIWKYVLTDTNHYQFAPNTIQFLENEIWIESLIKQGFKKSNLIVTGNPMYDQLFKKLQQQSLTHNKKVINVLFAPSTLYEHGFWSEKQKNFTLRKIVEKICINKDKFKLIVKIHPSSSILSDYAPIINSVDPSITVYQEGGIEQFLSDIDVVITSRSSTAEVYALLNKKRIVICDFFTLETDQFVQQGIATQCKDPNDLINSINKSLESKTYEKNREIFIDKFLYKWDGNSSKRIGDYLINILENKNN